MCYEENTLCVWTSFKNKMDSDVDSVISAQETVSAQSTDGFKQSPAVAVFSLFNLDLSQIIEAAVPK